MQNLNPARREYDPDDPKDGVCPLTASQRRRLAFFLASKLCDDWQQEHEPYVQELMCKYLEVDFE